MDALEIATPRTLPGALTRALAHTVALDGALLWRKLRRLTGLAHELRPELQLFASILFVRRADVSWRAAALAAEAASESAAAVAAMWRNRWPHQNLRQLNGLFSSDAPDLQWAVTFKHGALADYACAWRAHQQVPQCAAASMPPALAALLEKYATVLLAPEWPSLYSAELISFADGLAAATTATLAGTALRPLAAVPPGSMRAIVAVLQTTEASTLAYLGAETEINDSCGINLAAMSCEIMETLLANKELFASDRAQLQLSTELAIISALLSRVLAAAETAAPSENELPLMAALRESAAKDSLEWRLLKPLIKALLRVSAMVQQKNTLRWRHAIV
jgi:hypothetical protein